MIVDLYRVLEVVTPCANLRGSCSLFRLTIRPYHYHAEPRLFCGGLPLAPRRLARTLSNTFYNQLKAILFDSAKVGSTPE